MLASECSHVSADTEIKMAYDLIVVFRAPETERDQPGSVWLRQENSIDDTDAVVLTVYQLPALIAELQRIYDAQKKALGGQP